MDALGQRISPGDIIIKTDARMTGFDIAVVKLIKPNVVYLAEKYGSTRKQKENTVVISEEQLIGYLTKEIASRQNRDGTYSVFVRGVGSINLTLNEAIQNRIKYWIQLSRTLKNIPLGEYAITTENEQQELDDTLNKK